VARLTWRSPLDSDGRHLAAWLDDMRGEGLNGVYLIRDYDSREVLYIGESHSGRLFETMTRHLYQWNGRGSGPAYHADDVEIAVIVAETPLDDPVADQFALIQQYDPPDNVMDGHTLFYRGRRTVER
jgi:hypothetical protein